MLAVILYVLFIDARAVIKYGKFVTFQQCCVLWQPLYLTFPSSVPLS